MTKYQKMAIEALGLDWFDEWEINHYPLWITELITNVAAYLDAIQAKDEREN